MSQPPQPHRAYDEGSYDLYNHALYQSSNSDPTAQPQGHATSYSTSSVGPDPAQQHARKRSAFAADADLSGYSEARDSSTALAEPLPGKGQISADGYASPSPDDKWAPGLVSPPSLSHAFTPPHLVAGSFTPLDGSPGDSVDFLSPGAGAGSTSAHARAASGGASPLPASSASSTALPSPARDGASMPGSASRYGLVDPNIGVSALYYHDLGDLDDDLHRVGPNDAKGAPETNKGVSARGVLNIATMVILVLALLMLFAGYPIMTAVRTKHDALGAFGPGGTNGSGQVSSVPGVRTSLIDPDTPQDAYTRQSGVESSTMHLVFSDEFNAPGRSFYPGDDPFWEAVDLHYWATNNYEWYDPAAVTTANGALHITLSQHPEHNLNFRGGMIQSWNKFCFTGGVLVAGVRLPGKAKVAGLWPAVWLMGNLGRAGYGATLEGTWPYSYDTCDIGTLPNQTDPATMLPDVTKLGNCGFNQKHLTKSLSFLPGQRLSACTCPGDDHPGPQFPNGSYAGRMAPEIDLFEAQVNQQEGMTVSQSGQFAPYNAYYRPMAPPMLINKHSIANSYTGEITQQSMSGVTPTDQQGVQYLPDRSAGIFTEYAVEYKPGHGGYVQWWASGTPAWRLTPEQLVADPVSQIAERPVPPEPMYILANVGISQNFGTPSWNKLVWPSTMEIDYIRVYQSGSPNVGCDPPDYPTAAYIARHQEAYTNPNYTLWGGGEGGYGADWPRNRLNPGGCGATISKNPGSPSKPVPKARAYASAAIGNHQKQCDVSSWNKGQIQN